eukprot:GILK01015051.1.p1 GENE.GILK01015051.1~~GILK01015051.1.p1  ORF type:complete len:184 (-),score=39.47 GILK01015051.1:90-602(-)
MPKAKKERRKAQNPKPYEKDDTSMIIDEAEQQLQQEISSLPADIGRHAFSSDADGEMSEPQSKGVTRGAILQRHKREWRELRSRLDDMKRNKSKLKKKQLDQKSERRDISRNMKQLLEDMKKRHEDELSVFDGHSAAAASLCGPDTQMAVDDRATNSTEENLAHVTAMAT